MSEEPTEAAAPASEQLVTELATERLRVLSHYAYYDDQNVLRSWAPGTIVEDPDEIALLLDRAGHAVERA